LFSVAGSEVGHRILMAANDAIRARFGTRKRDVLFQLGLLDAVIESPTAGE